MEINIKLKFDKKSKNKLCSVLEPPRALPSTRRLSSISTHKSPRNTRSSAHRERSKDYDRDTKKTTTAKKTLRNSTKEPEHSTLHKQPPESARPSKNKLNLLQTSLLVQDNAFRGSLPGLSGKKVLQRYAPLLSENQKLELINEKTVYYIGAGVGNGEDDLDGAYLWRKHQQIGYRYQLLESLGSGTFGEVVRSLDHKCKEFVAVKIIKSKKQHMQLALNEITILMKAKEKDMQNERNILRIKDFIVFRKHICIVTEILSVSLYELMEGNSFHPLDIKYIRIFGLQLLNALAFLKENLIVHSDLKPENVLLRSKGRTGLKLIDFGTSMFLHECHYSYIQSRFYRAPEVILGTPYDFAIDMWSFGCVLAQLYLGAPLFPGNNQQQQLSLIFQLLGLPSREYLKNCKNLNNFFNRDFTPKLIKGKDARMILPGSRPIKETILDTGLANLLEKVLVVDPLQRLTPHQALLHPWLLEAVPETKRQQHISFAKSKENQVLNRNKPEASQTRHRKRNSDVENHRQSPRKHFRRGSEGVFRDNPFP